MKSLILSLQKKSELCTGLSNQVEMHIMQAIIFGDQKFGKLEEKYSSHAKEEREFQKKFTSRILDFEGKVELQQREALNLIEDLLWSETELELIEKIGKENWLLLQL